MLLFWNCYANQNKAEDQEQKKKKIKKERKSKKPSTDQPEVDVKLPAAVYHTFFRLWEIINGDRKRHVVNIGTEFGTAEPNTIHIG